jgi:NAD(P)-dependent dehydrogenase (short-subunit alcohol dehydrogenase family)
MYDFKGKTAMVTGAAMGIGKEVALRLAEEGANLALVDIAVDGLKETAREAVASHVEVLNVVADVKEREDVVKALDATIDKFGCVDFLVNVAGVGVCNQFFDVTDEEWDRTIDVNLKGTFLFCQVIGRHMADRQQGRIINIASIVGKTGNEILVPYCASKGGVILLTQSVSRSLAPFGIRVNSICPGLVWTPMWSETASWIGKNDPNFRGKDLSPEEVYTACAKGQIPLGIPTTTKDVAASVAFLLSDEASSITGQAVNVDGGIEVH